VCVSVYRSGAHVRVRFILVDFIILHRISVLSSFFLFCNWVVCRSNMFYKKWMKRTIRLHPQSFGRKMSEVLHKTLEMEVRGVSLGKAGYCVCVLQVRPGDGGGKIQEGTGMAIFQLHFEAVMFRPFKNEIMDVKVLNCVHLGFFGYAGPVKVFVSRHQMPQDMQDGYNAMDEAWLSEDKEVEIKENCGVRLKIISCTLENQQWTCVGTIAEEYLGLVDMG
jgi:DNA-directed RNA polymerase II subunit RPB7